MANASGRAPVKTSLPSALKLARWQLRQTWGLLSITGIGIVAAVMLVCAVPLYASVAMSAGLRGVLTSTPGNAAIVVRAQSTRIDAALVAKTTAQLNAESGKYLGAYLEPPQFSLQVPPYTIIPASQTSQGPHVTNTIGLVGAPTSQAGPHLHLLRGHLPQNSGGSPATIELAVTAQTAAALRAGVGATLKASVDYSDANQAVTQQVLQLRIVGIFSLASADDPFWQGEDFSIETPNDFLTVYRGLVSNNALLAVMTRLSNAAAAKGRYLLNSANVIWYYRLDPSRISINNLAGVLNGINSIKVDNSNNSGLDQSPFLDQTQTYQQSDILQQYQDRTSVARLPVLGLLVLMLGLVLFFVSLMAELLVDRQADAIAVLRSRGASGRQVLSALMLQSMGIGLVALAVGPGLAFYVVRFTVQLALAPADQGALALVASNPLQGAIQLGAYALLAVTVAIAAMAFSVRQAMRRDILSMRREAARSTRRPLWLQLNLDIGAALIALIGYAISLYLSNTGLLDARLRLLLLSPLTLLEATFLLIGGTLIFLRFFPRILRLGTGLALRSRGSTPMLALAQMSRAPRQSLRMTLLLALTTSFAMFTLIFTASQAQRVQDVAVYQSGADFSGPTSINILNQAELTQETSNLLRIRGVRSVSLGYTTPALAGSGSLSFPINFTAVDSGTFAQTASWTIQDATQPLPTLMKLLTTHTTHFSSSLPAGQTVPALVDAAAWNTLHLSPGASFALNFGAGGAGAADLVHFTAVALVKHIPSAGNESTLPGFLVDFRTFNAAYAHDYAGSTFFAPVNYAWLRTASDAPSLASVRNALGQGGDADLQLEPLYDRRALVATLYHEPLYLTLSGSLALGAATALLLAIVGNLIASWLSARQRLTHFAILRAIGASPAQVAGALTWEQCIIYTTAIVLGILFGLLFSFLVVPGLVFTSIAPTGAGSTISGGAFYSLQSIPPIQIILPGSLGVALGLLIALCVIALAMMVRVVAHSSIGQALRLSED